MYLLNGLVADLEPMRSCKLIFTTSSLGLLHTTTVFERQQYLHRNRIYDSTAIENQTYTRRSNQQTRHGKPSFTNMSQDTAATSSKHQSGGICHILHICLRAKLTSSVPITFFSCSSSHPSTILQNDTIIRLSSRNTATHKSRHRNCRPRCSRSRTIQDTWIVW